MTETTADPRTSTAITVREVVDGQTAARLIVAADDYSWWSDLLDGRTIRPTS